MNRNTRSALDRMAAQCFPSDEILGDTEMSPRLLNELQDGPPRTVTLPVRLPRRPFLIMSPSRSTEVGSPTMQKSSRSPRAASCSQTTTVPSMLGPSSSLVIR